MTCPSLKIVLKVNTTKKKNKKGSYKKQTKKKGEKDSMSQKKRPTTKTKIQPTSVTNQHQNKRTKRNLQKGKGEKWIVSKEPVTGK